MKLTKDKLRRVIREELVRESVMDDNLDQLKQVRSELGKLEKDVSDQGFEGHFTVGQVEDAQRKFKEVRNKLEEIERLFVEAQAQNKKR